MSSIYEECVDKFDAHRESIRYAWDLETAEQQVMLLDQIAEACKKMEAQDQPHIGRLLTLWAWVSEEWAWDEVEGEALDEQEVNEGGEWYSKWQQGSWIIVPADQTGTAEYTATGNACDTAYCCAGWGLHHLGLTDRQIRFLSDLADDDLLCAIADAYLGIGDTDHSMYDGENDIHSVKGYIESFTGLDLPALDANALYQRVQMRREAEKIAREARLLNVT